MIGPPKLFYSEQFYLSLEFLDCAVVFLVAELTSPEFVCTLLFLEIAPVPGCLILGHDLLPVDPLDLCLVMFIFCLQKVVTFAFLNLSAFCLLFVTDQQLEFKFEALLLVVLFLQFFLQL